VRLKVSANPVQQRGAGGSFGHFDREMGASKTNALIHQLRQHIAPFSAIEGMSVAAIREEEDRIGALKGFGILRPALRMNFGLDPWNTVQALRQEMASGIEFVLSSAVARGASQQNDFLFRRACVPECEQAKDRCEKPSFPTMFHPLVVASLTGRWQSGISSLPLNGIPVSPSPEWLGTIPARSPGVRTVVKLVTIHSDGACHGNPGPGGWAATLEYGRQKREISGGALATTNNRMELQAAIEALRALKEPCRIDFYTDSQYLRQGVTGWIRTWKSNGWRTTSRQPVKNADLWLALDQAAAPHRISWHWLKGHAGHAGNERCDALATIEIARIRKTTTQAELRQALRRFLGSPPEAEDLLNRGGNPPERQPVLSPEEA
jgi:ribonuclease HI